MLQDKFTILDKACLIPLVAAFFKIFYQLARIIGTFKAIGQSFISDTIFYFAFTAVFRFRDISSGLLRAASHTACENNNSPHLQKSPSPAQFPDMFFRHFAGSVSAPFLLCTPFPLFCPLFRGRFRFCLTTDFDFYRLAIFCLMLL